jgi:endonuclease/exonuclease/phosphatase family metal-dependent hydrolase
MSNCAELIQVIQHIQAAYPVPLFCIGDFNCHVDSDPIQQLLELGLAPAQGAAIAATSDSNGHHPVPVWDETSGTFGYGTAPFRTYSRAIDHIFYIGEQVKVWVYATVTDLEALDSTDHCPIYADISI